MAMKKCNRCVILEDAVGVFQWMARRYADNRQTYATSMFNSSVRQLLRLGVRMNTNDHIIWARDRGGRDFDGLTDLEAVPGTREAKGANYALQIKKIRKRIQGYNKIRPS